MAIREYPISGQSLTPKSVQDNTKKSFLQQRWENLAKWAPMAESGLRKLTDAEVSAQNYIAQKTGLPIGTLPTGNVIRDLIANTPRIVGETLTETAPQFISRPALVA